MKLLPVSVEVARYNVGKRIYCRTHRLTEFRIGEGLFAAETQGVNLPPSAHHLSAPGDDSGQNRRKLIKLLMLKVSLTVGR